MIIRFFFLFVVSIMYGQASLDVVPSGSVNLIADQFIGVDNFNSLYYSVGNKIIKTKTDGTSINFSNVQLGDVTEVNIFNPLKINAFYDQFNTVIVLDNRLAEVYKIDFNDLKHYKNVSFISTGYDNTVWLFNQDLQQLELFDYKINKTRATTLPIDSNPLDLKSDYNYCWLLTEDFIYQYNYFGSLVSKFKNEGFDSLRVYDENLILKKDNSLFYKLKESTEIMPIEMPELLIKQFLLTNETLYIYDLEKLHSFQLKID